MCDSVCVCVCVCVCVVEGGRERERGKREISLNLFHLSSVLFIVKHFILSEEQAF